MNELYYNVEQIAQMLNIHPKTIQRYIREGKLRATKIGKSWRVSGHDLSRFTEGANIASDESTVGHSAKERTRASSVIDISVIGKDEAIRIINSLTAAMNVKLLLQSPDTFGYKNRTLDKSQGSIFQYLVYLFLI